MDATAKAIPRRVIRMDKVNIKKCGNMNVFIYGKQIGRKVGDSKKRKIRGKKK